MDNVMLYVLIGVLIGWACSLSSGVIIGYMIFKTKRDSHESLFPGREKQGEVFNIEEDWEKELPETTKTPEEVAKAAIRFRSNFANIKPKIADELSEEKENV